ncbi:FHA domain-containing protein [Spirulina major CS-329]|uniref:FHA domain-containing protein n=1 Tax=Spirulina TaxID=1154 RepID=UPI0023311696|nr:MULTISPECIES: FHA domain-containing protein [Spirulina]MDB9494617.1 FHA domain-containing protein [Spirulina subsalsa CS-330]MDB9505187.1 FHA domain-containing protein [Spirulina major CS-329]
MIVCPNCSHQNPEGATQCEACYTPLPSTTSCPNCGTSVQSDASFCGQCGFSLQATSIPTMTPEANTPPPLPDLPPDLEVPELEVPELDFPESMPDLGSNVPDLPPPLPDLPPPPPVGSAATQLQLQTAQLLHVQTNSPIELPQNLAVIHLGKPGGPIPPDIDVSGFPDSAVVSRVHADIRMEGDAYYIEDVGSSNGTYINHSPLLPGNRHRLRAGDRIALGKEDKVTFIFQIN